MNKIVEERILRQAAAIEELHRLDRIKVTVPQSYSLRLTYNTDNSTDNYINACDNYPHCHITKTLADKAFRLRLSQGIDEYRRLLTIMAETGEV